MVGAKLVGPREKVIWFEETLDSTLGIERRVLSKNKNQRSWDQIPMRLLKALSLGLHSMLPDLEENLWSSLDNIKYMPRLVIPQQL